MLYGTWCDATLCLFLQLKIYQKLLSFQLNSSAQRNLRTLYVYHTFSTLQPLLSSGGKSAPRPEGIPGISETGGIMKVLGGIKLSVPAVELIIHAVESVKFLCEEVDETRGEGEGGATHLTPQGMDVGVVYSASECMEMLLGYLPLYKDLFSLVMATFKKIQAHVSGVGWGRKEERGWGREGERGWGREGERGWEEEEDEKERGGVGGTRDGKMSTR